MSVLTGTTKQENRRIHSKKQRRTSLWGHVKAEVSMSALGHKRKFSPARKRSALCHKQTSRPLPRTRTLHDSLVPSGHRIIPKYVRFHFQLSKTVLENITNADDPHEPIAVLDRHMANTPHGHQLHDVSRAVLRRADSNRLRHQFGDWDRWQPASICRKAVGKIALGNDAFDRVPVSAHDQGTNLLSTHLPRE